MQLEKLILEYKPTMLFVEHDSKFCEKIATKVIELEGEAWTGTNEKTCWKEEGEAYISTVLFDDECEVLHNRVTLEQIKPMADK